MRDGQSQRVDIPAQARTAHSGLPQNRLEADLCRMVPRGPRTQSVKALNNQTLRRVEGEKGGRSGRGGGHSYLTFHPQSTVKVVSAKDEACFDG